MVRAILDGQKTQTRLIVSGKRFASVDWEYVRVGDRCHTLAPYVPGDRLWVRETWAVQHDYDGFRPSEIGPSARWHYAATEDLGGLVKRPAIFLPRHGSRITLEIVGVRVERLQEISEDDARAEGCLPVVHEDGAVDCGTRKTTFRKLWQSIHGPGSWADNPFVWVVEFCQVATP